jgi:hypothetical protein
MVEGRVEIPNDPRLIAQFKSVIKKPMPGGKMQIRIPVKGRAHGDLAIAACLAIVQAADAAARDIPYDPHHDAALAAMRALNDSPLGGRARDDDDDSPLARRVSAGNDW